MFWVIIIIVTRLCPLLTRVVVFCGGYLQNQTRILMFRPASPFQCLFALLPVCLEEFFWVRSIHDMCLSVLCPVLGPSCSGLVSSGLLLMRFGDPASAPRTAAQINPLVSSDPQPLLSSAIFSMNTNYRNISSHRFYILGQKKKSNGLHLFIIYFILKQ